jgi:hypothetical protein
VDIIDAEMNGITSVSIDLSKKNSKVNDAESVPCFLFMRFYYHYFCVYEGDNYSDLVLP